MSQGNPYRYTDSSGHYIESAVDVAFITYDLHEIEDDPSLVNYLSLAADSAALIVPFATGGGLAVRGTASGVRSLGGASRSSDLVVQSQRIADRLGPTTTGVGGTLKHSEAEKLLKQGMKDVYTEVPLKDSVVVSRRTPLSTRVDAIQSSQDLSKIGTSGLTP